MGSLDEAVPLDCVQGTREEGEQAEHGVRNRSEVGMYPKTHRTVDGPTRMLGQC
jgi:hypothetical protein